MIFSPKKTFYLSNAIVYIFLSRVVHPVRYVEDMLQFCFP